MQGYRCAKSWHINVNEKHYGVKLDSEESAYLTGYLMR